MPVLATIALLAAYQGLKMPGWPVPIPRIFASQGGAYAFRVLLTPDKAQAIGELCKPDDAGELKPVWRKLLVCVPVEAYVSELGHVATIDQWGGKGKEHALVMYDRTGKTLADYPLSELFPGVAPEKNPYMLTVGGNVLWTLNMSVMYVGTVQLRNRPDGVFAEVPKTESGVVLRLQMPSSEILRFDPDTGKLLDRRNTPVGG